MCHDVAQFVSHCLTVDRVSLLFSPGDSLRLCHTNFTSAPVIVQIVIGPLEHSAQMNSGGSDKMTFSLCLR